MASDREAQVQITYDFLQHLDRSGFENVRYLRQQFNDYKGTIEAAKIEPVRETFRDTKASSLILYQLSASSLDHEEAITMFGLGDGQSWVPWYLKQDELYNVSDSLSKTTFSS